MPTTLYAGLVCLALASFDLLWSGGALGLTLHALQPDARSHLPQPGLSLLWLYGI